jgi:MoxR-like ATPase
MDCIFHFHRNTSLPINGLVDFLNDRDLYTGNYGSFNDETAAIARRSLYYSNGNKKMPTNSGMMTAGFAKALNRALQVHTWPMCGDGYGYNNTADIDNQTCVAAYTVSSTYNSQKIGFGTRLSILYKFSSNKFFLGDEKGNAKSLADVQKTLKVYSEPFLFCMWGYYMQDKEFHDTFNKLLVFYKRIIAKASTPSVNKNDVDAAKKCACKLADIAYFMSTRDKVANSKLESRVIPNPTVNSVGGLYDTLVATDAAAPTFFIGNISPFKDSRGKDMAVSEPEPESEKPKTAADLEKAFLLNKKRVLTDTEKALLIIPDSHIPGVEAYSLCKHIQKSSKTPRPIRNILLRGEAGTGKTETAKDIALGLGLPYVFVTCSSDTEIYDLLGQMMPNKPNETPMSIDEYQNAYGDLDLNALPTATDISNDPEMAYKAITGKKKRDATEVDCLAAIIQHAAAGSMNSGANGFHYVESPLIQAIRNGWVCEIQEPTVIAKPGVLVGLNGLLDSTSAVNLPTGETIRRHPDAVIIATTNISYEGCRDMNQSVLSRFQIKMDIHAPVDTILAERLRSMTGCPKSVKVPQILKAYHAVLNTLKTLYLTDGSVDLRTLADWISSYMITGSYMESAEMTIIPSATADEEGINKVREVIRKLV